MKNFLLHRTQKPHGYAQALAHVMLVEESERKARFSETYREYKRRMTRWLPLRRKHG